MKYLMMIYDNAQSRELFTGPDGAGLMAEMHALLEEVTASGELLGHGALADPSATKTIKPVDGTPAITDGPLAEAKEHFGGWMLLDCETPERAQDIALRFPAARFTPVELRPVMETGGADM
jgi:hypothetical protein